MGIARGAVTAASRSAAAMGLRLMDGCGFETTKHQTKAETTLHFVASVQNPCVPQEKSALREAA